MFTHTHKKSEQYVHELAEVCLAGDDPVTNMSQNTPTTTNHSLKPLSSLESVCPVRTCAFFLPWFRINMHNEPAAPAAVTTMGCFVSWGEVEDCKGF